MSYAKAYTNKGMFNIVCQNSIYYAGGIGKVSVRSDIDAGYLLAKMDPQYVCSYSSDTVLKLISRGKYKVLKEYK